MITLADLTRIILQAPTTLPATAGHVWVNGGLVCMTPPPPAVFTLDTSVLDGPDPLA